MKRTLLPSIFLLLVIMAIFSGCAGKPPAERGVSDGKLMPCPYTPNCVSTMMDDDSHGVEPFYYGGRRQAAQIVLKEVLAEIDGVEIQEEREDYIWAECTSRFMGFVDDLEFYFPMNPTGVIHIRSASRVGYSDLGVNRKRVEEIRKRFVKGMGD